MDCLFKVLIQASGMGQTIERFKSIAYSKGDAWILYNFYLAIVKTVTDVLTVFIRCLILHRFPLKSIISSK